MPHVTMKVELTDEEILLIVSALRAYCDNTPADDHKDLITLAERLDALIGG